MLLTRNKRDTKNITLLNKLVAHGETLEYIKGEWWYEGRCYNSLLELATYMMIPLSSTNYVFESYAGSIHTENT